MLMLGGHQRGRMCPILKERAGFHGTRQQAAVVRAEACKYRQLLAAHKHIHRVNLDDADAIEQLLQVALRHRAFGAGSTKALRGKCKLARIACRELDWLCWQRAVAAPVGG